MDINKFLEDGCFLKKSILFMEFDLLHESILTEYGHEEGSQSRTLKTSIDCILKKKEQFKDDVYMDAMCDATLCNILLSHPSSNKKTNDKIIVKFVDCCGKISLSEKSKHMWTENHHIIENELKEIEEIN